MQHREGGQSVRAQSPPLAEPALKAGHGPWVALHPRAHLGGKHACDFLCARMEILGQLHDVFIPGAHFTANPLHARRAGFQISNANDVVVTHCIGDIFRRGL